MKKVLFHALSAGIVSALAAIGYNYAYSHALAVDFSKVVTIKGLLGCNILACLIATLGYYYFSKLIKRHTDTWFNIIFILLTFATFIGVFSFSLPLDVESPELFVGLAIPIHLFPVMFWMGLKSLFWR